MTEDTILPAEDDDDEAEVPPAPALDREHHLRLLEALLFAAAEPLDEGVLAARFPEGTDLRALLTELAGRYVGHGIELARMERRWAFRTAADLAPWLRLQEDVQRKLSRAAVETLAIIAYHQPVTRAEIESIRGVATSKGTLDLLMENTWIKPGRRRETPGRPLTWVTTEHFLDHFGLAALRDLPGIEDLRAAGLLDARPVLTALPGGLVKTEEEGEG
ncbi:MAG: SMC-Scp complex subunit ScpB [Rhodospirillaceae bacterium]